MSKVNRISLTEQIKSILIERIVDGVLVPGDRLKELKIAEEFGTSQAPVREAIRGLQAQGYVDHRPHIGAVVKSFSQQETEEAYRIREALEGHCLVVADLDLESLISSLRNKLDQMKRGLAESNVRTFSEADNDFHRAIIEASQNERMLEVWDSLKIQTQIMATIVEASMDLQQLYDLHPPIVEALEDLRRQKAAAKLIQHYETLDTHWKKHG